MKITVKTINPNSNLVFDLEPTDTVGTIKARIAQEKGDAFSVELQKLIRSGKILSDESVTIESLHLSEKDFFVCMPTKVTKPTASASSKEPEVTAPKEEKAEKVATPAAATAAPADATSPSTSAPPEAFTSLATGSNLELAINNLIEMGYPREKVVRAMRAAFNNPDRAAEYLLTDTIPSEPAQAPPVTSPSTATQQDPSTPSSGANDDSVNLFALAAQQRQQRQQQPSSDAAAALGALRNSPQVAQLRQLIQSNPALLEPLLMQMGASNPAILQALSSNPQALAELLGEGLGGGSDEDAMATNDDAAAPSPTVIRLTTEENAAIDRLVALGFERNIALEAFLACDKNEEVAANYLFDSAGFN